MESCLATRVSRRRPRSNSRGFSLIELLVVIAITLVAAGMSLWSYSVLTRYLRIAGDSRNLNGMVALAKMRAAQDFTHARVYADLSANTYHMEVWDKTANSGAGCWKTEGDVPNACTLAGTSPVQQLSQGVVFGFGGITSALPNPQATIGQAPTCNTGVAGGTAGTSIANTSCIEFNSRGIPVAPNGSANSGSPTASDALYVTDTVMVYGVTVIQTGLIQNWATSAAATAWQAR
jgi:prepilin-type N-terminal cleavage/methylation domain-containing protein